MNTYYILLLIALAAIAFGLYVNFNKSNAIEDCSEAATAEIVDKQQKTKSSYSIRYRYNVAGKDYFGKQIVDTNVQNKYSVGNTINISYHCDDVALSKIS